MKMIRCGFCGKLKKSYNFYTGMRYVRRRNGMIARVPKCKECIKNEKNIKLEELSDYEQKRFDVIYEKLLERIKNKKFEQIVAG